MKKLLTIVLVLLLAGSLAACSGKVTGPTATQAPAATDIPVATEAPVLPTQEPAEEEPLPTATPAANG